MERNAQAPVATFVVDSPFTAGRVALGPAAAHHARVRRLSIGTPVRLTDGAGRVGRGDLVELDPSALAILVTDVEQMPPPAPIHLLVPVADRERSLWLAEKATELGIATWQSVHFRRSSSVATRGEGEAFVNKLRLRMIAAVEQSGGTWLPQILPAITLERLRVQAGTRPILLDVGGAPLDTIFGRGHGAAPVILCGPEGGIEDAELDHLRREGWRAARVGVTTLRFETAAIAAVAACRIAQLPVNAES